MILRPTACLLVLLAAPVLAAEPAYKLEPVAVAPAGLSPEIVAKLAPHGARMSDAKGPVCEVWLARSIPVKAGFKASLSVHYPFQPGELIGALRVPDGRKFKDFRGQDVPAGSYTLRYGQQPEDGNHVGTSELADFLLALPAKLDVDPARPSIEVLAQRSAKSAGATHPAIYSLLPPKAAAQEAKLVHEADKHYWVLDVSPLGTAGEAAAPVPVRLVLVGKAEG
jgi:hypothetical protein